MIEILGKAGGYVFIILLGIILRKIGFFKESDFNILAKICLRITLPASVIYSFSGKEFDLSLISLCLIGFLAGVIYIGAGYLINRKSKERAAFSMVNLSGYNVGCFTVPFVQGFLGPLGVITTSLFDVGNAMICLGGSYSVASITKEGGPFSIKKIGKALITSVTFITYMVMIILRLLRIELPTAVVDCAGVIGGANAFVAMLMLGVGFKLSIDKEQFMLVLKTLGVRYAIGAVLALVFWFALPFDREIRLALIILAFAPIASAAPAYTAELGEDSGVASTINSLSVICSIVIIITILTFMA